VYQDWGEIINFDYERLTQGFGTGPRIKFPDELHDLPKVSNPTGLENWGQRVAQNLAANVYSTLQPRLVCHLYDVAPGLQRNALRG
ncbi:MAG: hypothetical protein AAGI44_19420, partial [Pseudomonadota bacterium]